MIQSLNRAFEGSEDVHQRWHELLAMVIKRGQENREFRRDIDADRAAFVVHGVYMATLFMWLKCPDVEFKLQDELRARLALVVDGLKA